MCRPRIAALSEAFSISHHTLLTVSVMFAVHLNSYFSPFTKTVMVFGILVIFKPMSSTNFENYHQIP